MSKVAKLNVKLLNYTHDAEQIIAAAIRQCYSALGANELSEKISPEKRKALINQIINSGHTSTIEHALFTFAIEGISRVTSHQLVRHRIASYSQQSQRYVDFTKKDSFCFIVPPSIIKAGLEKEFIKDMEQDYERYKYYAEKGVPAEDARYKLPNACETKIVVSMNPRSLHNFFKERLCIRAQWEIRAMAREMLKLAEKKAPILFSNVGPSCETDLICRQGKRSCGKWKAIKGAHLVDPLE
jgi:thymidylate synthase (FAD)